MTGSVLEHVMHFGLYCISHGSRYSNLPVGSRPLGSQMFEVAGKRIINTD